MTPETHDAVIQTWKSFYPNGIPPDEYPHALAFAETAMAIAKEGAFATPRASPPRRGAIRNNTASAHTARLKSSYSVSELAAIKGVSRMTVYSALHRDTLRARKNAKGKLRISAKDAEAWHPAL